jgi:hypothetical protein
MYNSWLQSGSKLSLTNSIDIVCRTISLLEHDYDLDEVLKNIKDIFLQYSNIAIINKLQVVLGPGVSYWRYFFNDID